MTGSTRRSSLRESEPAAYFDRVEILVNAGTAARSKGDYGIAALKFERAAAALMDMIEDMRWFVF